VRLSYRSRLIVRGRDVSGSAHEALVRRAIEAIWNRGDFDVADEVFAAAYVNHDGLIADLICGPEAIKISAALHRVAFPDLHVSVDEVSTVGDTVVFRWTARRFRDGPGSRVPGSESTSLTGITRSRVAAGKIVESWTEWDRLRVLGDLGILSNR
jgi:hypothetical protein